MEELEPTGGQLQQAAIAVGVRGWQHSSARSHEFCPKGIREADGKFRACEYCRAGRNPARWPLFFRIGDLAGQVLWTCSTCKLAQADRRGVAQVLVDIPADL